MRLIPKLVSVAAAMALAALPLPAQAASECGIASWYGYGYKTANGEEFDVSAMTAAHKTLPFGTVVRVENLRNGRSVTVRINDRGPFIEGRIVDLSLAAALEIGLPGPGIAPVRVVSLDQATEFAATCS